MYEMKNVFFWSIRYFDDPYKFELNGFFGNVPNLNNNPNGHRVFSMSSIIEQGEDALENLKLHQDDHLLRNPSSFLNKSDLNGVGPNPMSSDSDESTPSNIPDWEWVSFDSDNFELDINNEGSTMNRLSTVWRFATGFVKSSSPIGDERGL